MNKGDLVLVEAPARADYAIFIERLPFDRMAAVEIIKEKTGKGFSSPDTPGIRYLTKQKYLTPILSVKELKELVLENK